MRAVTPIIVLACAAGFLGGCQEVSVASIRGACDAFEAPTQPVLGKRKVDQAWIDRAVETGVTVCKWPRPKSQQVVDRAVAQMR